jgi:predicted CoA-substrate-specific enzyme activase
MITAGVDVGSLTGKALILKDNEIASWSLIPTGANSSETANKAIGIALEKADLSLDEIDFIVSTGYGRVVADFAQKNITEISCHAKGAHWLFPEARTILDMGGQDCKAIRCDESGKVTNFVMNDKCAAGAGRSVEIMAELLQVSLENIGKLSLEIVDEEIPISCTCVVFAKSEALSYLRRGKHRNDILAGVCGALSTRVHNLLNRVGIEKEFVISGGIAKNIGVVKRLTDEIGLNPRICFEPQIVGALGAALFAHDILHKKSSKN